LYGNDYTIVGARGDVRDDKQTRNHKVELVQSSSLSNIASTNNNNGSGEGENCPQAFKSTVIKGLKNAPNNTHTSFDVEQRLQVSSFSLRTCKLCLNYIASHSPQYHPCQKQFLDPFMRNGKTWLFAARECEKFPHIIGEGGKVGASHGAKNGLQISHFAISHVDGVSVWKKCTKV
jgi:hypothetical protein